MLPSPIYECHNDTDCSYFIFFYLKNKIHGAHFFLLWFKILECHLSFCYILNVINVFVVIDVWYCAWFDPLSKTKKNVIPATYLNQMLTCISDVKVFHYEIHQFTMNTCRILYINHYTFTMQVKLFGFLFPLNSCVCSVFTFPFDFFVIIPFLFYFELCECFISTHAFIIVPCKRQTVKAYSAPMTLYNVISMA